jgi:hypothetical protein
MIILLILHVGVSQAFILMDEKQRIPNWKKLFSDDAIFRY